MHGAHRGRRIVQGYWPLAVGVALLATVVIVWPSTGPDQVAATDVDAGVAGQAASGWGTSVTPCADRDVQVPDDPYSPPCFSFSGDNGGATSKGVTDDTITVSYRQTAEANVLALLAQLMGIDYDETAEDLQRTMAGLVDYFNQTFEMYGRKIDLQIFQGQGTLTGELVGGGREQASVDGLKAGTEVGAFADVTALSQPYAEALAANRTIGFGAPYMSRRWFTERRPYAWSLMTDCSVVAEAASAYGVHRLLGKPAAFAGGKLKDRPRKMAVITPNNAEYARCKDDGLALVAETGQSIDLVTDYVLDIGRIPAQAVSIAGQIVRQGITTISCFCDPLMLLSLTQQIDAQGLEPEWIVTGVGFVDLDLIGQGIAAANHQWRRAFGASPLAEQEPVGHSAGYRAFKSVHPEQEPSLAVDVFYYQLYQLALGIQMAGPDLTPENLETGLFAYPPRSGPAGRWDYFPTSYTPISDLREIWWDPDRVSPFNGAKGSYDSTGERFDRDDLERIQHSDHDEQPPVFPR